MSAPTMDWRSLPLAGDGRCLVEASAGTGKTWTIAALYLRLLLEDGLLPRQIVVTTFGVAAAQELRERIRARIVATCALTAANAPLMEADASSVEPGSVESWLAARWIVDAGASARDGLQLRLALAELDLAPIVTLHGLCTRLLAAHPLATGSTFAAAAMTGGEALDTELRDDRWRYLAQADAQGLDPGDRAWFAGGGGRNAFAKALGTVCKPGFGVRAIAFDPAELDAAMRPENAPAIRQWLPQALFKSARSVLRRGLESLAAYVEAADAYAPLPEGMIADLGKPLESQFKPASVEAARAHPVVAFAQRMPGILALAQAQARAESLARHRELLFREREIRLLERGQVTFDALIARARGALDGAQGDELATRLRKDWPVALVDEFQDTDAQQYAILDRIYRDAADAPQGRLVMIGDPKQAIYRFRGGDIEAYLDARKAADDILRLSINRRSSAAYVAACNELFASPGDALSQQADAPIRYEPALPGSGPKQGALSCDGKPCAQPLAFHLLQPEEDEAASSRPAGRRPSASVRREQALAACANQIASLLQERRHRIGERLLAPGDLAVLLPTNNDIARLRELLAARGVPCVGTGTQGVFQADIARELLVLLHGIEHGHDAAAVRAALATRFFLDRDFDALRALSAEPAAWQRELARFADWRRQWREEGVQAVIAAVVAANARRLAAGADCERVLTDLRHLGELLQAASAHGDGPAGLLAWFAGQREGDAALDEDAAEEQQLRIESDARRVRLMTLHKSKGLQFPVVFLPLMWAAQGKAVKQPFARDPASGQRLLDLGGPDAEAACRENEWADQDERFRVLYVALTRAQHACHAYAIDDDDSIADPKRSALTALLARLQLNTETDGVEEACPHIRWSSGWEWPRLDYLADHGATASERRALPLPAPRPYAGRHSFTTLAQHRDAADGTNPAGDEGIDPVLADAETADAPEHPELAALSAWRGTAFGNAFHAIFEQRAIGRPMHAQHELVHSCLEEAGLDSSDALVRRIAARVQSVLDAPLPCGEGSAVRLSDLPAHRMRAEMDFRYAVDAASVQRLREACARHGEPDLVPGHAPSVLRGLMVGAIDLVFEHEGRFHVLDYKSNFLGDRLADYANAALRTAMDHHHYRFQALLYAVALDRYLRTRLRDGAHGEHLGAAIYLFVRAVGLAPDAGIWSQRFDPALLADVDAALAGISVESAA